jgi:hypothetical protein
VIAVAVLRRRGSDRVSFRTPRPRLVLSLAFAATVLLVVASGITGALGGIAWLAAGLAGYRLTLSKRPAAA